MVETSPGPREEQGAREPARSASPSVSGADYFTILRLPLALAFVLFDDYHWKLAVLFAAAASDLLDGYLARHYGGSRLGSFLDPVADKLFMLCAFLVVAASRRLEWYEIVGVLLRDLVATVAFLATVISRRPMAIPARLGGKAVTVAQMLTLVAFLLDSPLLRPMAWATAAVAIYAIWDYRHAAPTAQRPL